MFAEYGHDVHTVTQEGLGGAADDAIFELCRSESRCLITLDLDFADVLRFPPQDSSGIVIIRCPRNPSLPLLEQLVRSFLTLLEKSADLSPVGHLWIVEIDRIRVHQQRDPGGAP